LSIVKDILKQLNTAQQSAVAQVKGPVLVLAGAGSGKTRVLTHRLAYLIAQEGVRPEQILAVTFTNKAAGEMALRARELLNLPAVAKRFTGFALATPAIGTFHSVCARILREDIGALGALWNGNYTIFDGADVRKAIKQVLSEAQISLTDFNPRIIAKLLDQAKMRLVEPEQFLDEFKDDLPPPVLKIVQQIYGHYQNYLAEVNALDFSDLLFKTVLLLRDYPLIRQKYQNRWQYILVDEYQDTNYAQYEFCRLLAAGHQNLFVVGDDYQSIYGFRGANLDNILNFTRDYPKTKTFLLEQNYRSTQSILNLANAVIAKNRHQNKKVLWTENPRGVLPQIVEVEDERAEAEFVISQIAKLTGKSKSTESEESEKRQTQELEYEYEDQEQCQKPGRGGILDRVMASRRGERPSARLNISRSRPVRLDGINLNTFVVLYRTNAQSRALEEVLLDWNVPYKIIGGVRFYERQEIKDLLAYLRLLANHRDLVSLERVINIPPRGIGPKTWQYLATWLRNNNFDFAGAKQFFGSEVARGMAGPAKKVLPFFTLWSALSGELDKLSVAEMIIQIAESSGYFEHLKATQLNFTEREENIRELASAAVRYSTGRGLEALRGFLEEIALVSDIDSLNDQSQALTLMTIHSAKGLEFETVFMVGLEQGLLPHASATLNPAELEEERRLCYVGITRARERLYLTHTRQRQLYGALIYPQVSEFVAGVDRKIVEWVRE